MLEQAIALAKQGFHVFPLKPGTKRPMFKDWENLASTDPKQIARWWRAIPGANIAIACGPSNLLVIDLDKAKKPGGPQHGQQTLTALAAGRQLPDTFTVASARGGRHLYFRQPEGAPLRNTAGSVTAGLGPLIDTRGHGGFVVAPGSVFEGSDYRVESEAAVASLPAWIVDELSTRRMVADSAPAPALPRTPTTDRRRGAYGDTALSRSADTVATAPEGTRNDTLNREAFRMGRLVGGGVLHQRDVADELRRAAERAGLSPGEAANTIASGLAAGISRPRSIPDRDPLPQNRPQPKEDVMSSTPDASPETVIEPERATAPSDDFEDIWSDLRASFEDAHQALADWTDHDGADGLEPAMDEAARLVAQTVVTRRQSDNVGTTADESAPAVEPPADTADDLLAPVDAVYDDARIAGIPADAPEWTGISTVRDAMRNLWDTVKAVAGRYWAELSADIRVRGPLNALATRAALGIANLATRAADRLERSGPRQPRVESLASLREAYINARGQVRAHAATYEWQRISALWGTVNTLARQVHDPGIRAVVARSADRHLRPCGRTQPSSCAGCSRWRPGRTRCACRSS